MNITLKKMPLVAARGTHKSRIVGINQVTKTPDDEPCNLLVADVELVETIGANERPFVISKAYNLDGHGASSFAADYRAWSGVKLTPEQLNSFNTEEAINKPFRVKVDHRRAGKELIPIIVSWMPPETSIQS